MGVKVTNREYQNRYRPEIVDWLIGNVGDWQTLTLTCLFAVEKEFSQTAPLLVEASGFELVLGDGTEWSDYGFDVGDVITWSIRVTAYNSNGSISPGYPQTVSANRQIVLLQGDRLTLDNAWLNNIFMLPFEDGRSRIDQVIIYSDKQPQAAQITYGHITNSDADGGNLASFIDGSFTRFLAEDMDTLLGWQQCIFMGLQSGMSLRSARWIYDQKIGTHTYEYRFEVEFMISSFFEELANFEAMTAPSQVFDIESLTDNFEIIGYPEYNNPNTQIKNLLPETKRLGNTGWFDENYNGLTNNFKVLSVEYTNLVSGLPVPRISYGQETKVKAIISGIPNLAYGVSKLGFGFILLTENEILYKDLLTPFHQNLFVNTGGGIATGVLTPTAAPNPITYTGFTNFVGATMNIRSVHFYIQGGNLVYEAIFSPTAAFANLIGALDEDDRNYAIWISAADSQEPTNFADRVSILLDYNLMDLYVQPIGPYPSMNITFSEHHEDDKESKPIGCADVKVEDDLLAVVPFLVDITEEIPNRIEFVLEVENQNTGAKYELQRYSVDLTGYPTDGLGVPQWNFDQIRGFKLVAGNDKNWVKVQRDASSDNGNNKGYIAYYGFKIRWEDWIARTGVPNDFFNAAEENNGFNNDWVQYLGVAGWVFQFTVNTYSTQNGEAVKYVNSETLTFDDYDENADIVTTWEFIRESTSTNLPVSVDPTTGKPLGILLANEQVRLKVTYTKQSGNFADITDYYGTICIEVDKGAGQFEFRQLSTIWGSEGDNPLIPLAGETRTKKTLAAANKIVLECLVEPSRLIGAQRYKVSSRLGCISACIPPEEEQEVKIWIFLDNSGSMDASFEHLQYMRDNMLSDYLLPYYNDNQALFDESVIVENVNSERAIKMLNALNHAPPEGGLIVIVFQNEAETIYTDGGISPRTAAFDNDLKELRDRLDSFESGYFNGAIMQITGYTDFFDLMTAIKAGTPPYDGENGLQDKSEVLVFYNVPDGDTPKYYIEQIIEAIENFGL